MDPEMLDLMMGLQLAVGQVEAGERHSQARKGRKWCKYLCIDQVRSATPLWGS